MKITLNAELGGHKTGDTIEVTPGVADSLVEQGYAELAQDDTPKPRRRSSKIGKTEDEDEDDKGIDA